MQLEPHFLFNTLNAISAYVRADPATAEAMLQHLSAVLRAVLDGGRRAVTTVADEVALVRAYLAIHAVRLGERLSVSIEVAPDAAPVLIPTLLLQPLVENAIVHGAARRAGAVSVGVSVVREGDRVVCRIRDAGLAPVSAMVSGTSGVGLANTTARLAHVYGASATLSVEMTDHDTVVTVRLPLGSAVMHAA